MLIDEKGKILGKVSIIDILIVVIIIAGIGGVFYKFNKANLLNSSKSSDVKIVFFIEEVQDFVANSIENGAVVKDAIKDCTFGKVTNIEIAPSVSYSNDANGKITRTTKPGYNSLKITVVGRGTYTKTGVTYSGSDYYIGNSPQIRVGNTAIFARIYNITKGK